MGFWDDLWGRIQQTSDDAKKEATKRAAAAAVNRLKKQVESAADEALSAAEKELSEAQQARTGRTEYKPSEDGTSADSIISSADAMLSARRRGQPSTAPSATPYADQRKARQDRARAELEALKAKLKAGGALDDDDDDDDDDDAPPDPDAPIKRTL